LGVLLIILGFFLPRPLVRSAWVEACETRGQSPQSSKQVLAPLEPIKRPSRVRGTHHHSSKQILVAELPCSLVGLEIRTPAMAARRPVLGAAVVALVALAALWSATAPAASEQEVFVVTSPALRASRQGGAFAGAQPETAITTAVARAALPDPRPNDAMLPVDLNRTSLYWGLLCICILSVLSSRNSRSMKGY